MSSTICNDCGQCCIDVSFPKQLRAQSSCCYCGELKPIKICPNTVLQAGTILGPVTGQPMTYGAFDPDATDGRNQALLILAHDVATDANGNIVNVTGLWGCGRPLTEAYVCGKFDARDIVGDLKAAKASGLPVREIDGWVYFG